jgi:hypothetical protein
MTGLKTILAVLLIAAASLAAGEPVPAGRITLDGQPRTHEQMAAIIRAATGLAVDFGIKDNFGDAVAQNEPFWKFLERMKAEGRVNVFQLKDHGARITIDKGKPAWKPASVDGAFRVVAHEVVARRVQDQAGGIYEVTLDVHWEPRIPVFRIESTPTLVTAVDDRNVLLGMVTGNSKSPVGDAHMFRTTFQLKGLSRESKSIAKLEGLMTVTAAPKWLTFNYDDFNAKLPVVKESEGVSVSITKLNLVKNRFDVDLKLIYPEGHPQFESFESWADGNTLTLISPDRTKTYAPDSFAVNGSGRKVTAEYHAFSKAAAPVMTDRTGWTLQYKTPAPLVEFSVRFSLADIALP